MISYSREGYDDQGLYGSDQTLQLEEVLLPDAGMVYSLQYDAMYNINTIPRNGSSYTPSPLGDSFFPSASHIGDSESGVDAFGLLTQHSSPLSETFNDLPDAFTVAHSSSPRQPYGSTDTVPAFPQYMGTPSESLTVHPSQTNVPSMADSSSPRQSLDSHHSHHDHHQHTSTRYIVGGGHLRGVAWKGPANLRDLAYRLMTYGDDDKLPRDLLSLFLEKCALPKQARGKGSRNGAKGYVCLWNHCGRFIKRRDQAQDHVATHFHSRPFKCDSCTRAFLRGADLKRHQRESCYSLGNEDNSTEATTPSQESVLLEVWESIMVITVFFSLPEET